MDGYADLYSIALSFVIFNFGHFRHSRFDISTSLNDRSAQRSYSQRYLQARKITICAIIEYVWINLPSFLSLILRFSPKIVANSPTHYENLQKLLDKV